MVKDVPSQDANLEPSVHFSFEIKLSDQCLSLSLLIQNETSEILRGPSYDCVSNINSAKLPKW